MTRPASPIGVVLFDIFNGHHASAPTLVRDEQVEGNFSKVGSSRVGVVFVEGLFQHREEGVLSEVIGLLRRAAKHAQVTPHSRLVVLDQSQGVEARGAGRSGWFHTNIHRMRRDE